jgi:A/G-specific adenine glycosylase
MLQQTRVETVVRYYERFLERFPDVRALAEAEEGDVMKAWEGLGYYRRARLMHAGARSLARGFPRTAAGLRELPGFGPYTAGAVASLAFGEPAPAVDGNVLRVFARQAGVARPGAREAEAWVRAHQPSDAAGAFNEALMELGATVCTPRAPRCGACPVAASCRAPGDRYPVRAPKADVPTVRVSLALARRDGRVLMERREEGLLAGTWGLPWVEGGRGELAAHVERLVGASVVLSRKPAATGKHVFTHRRWSMRAFEATTEGARGEWRRPEDVALGTAHRRILDKLGTPVD